MQWNKFLEPTVWAVWLLIVGGAGLWVVVGSIGYFIKEGWLTSDASGWVQAVGSIAAILAAVWVAGRDSRERGRSETEAKRAALWRAYATVDDTVRRVESALQAAENMSLDKLVMVYINRDLNQTLQHLKEVISSPGVNSKIFDEVFSVRIAVENLTVALNAFSESMKNDSYFLTSARRAVSEVLIAREILKVMKVSIL
ncbi:hypothetical protein [Pseudomonas fragi]|uniref:hypothetical protein n=1 Tax=Pseudomonas fragi TaxID=296 RepID=UPI000BA2072E|nr:hypothetical protein [Pseudomonas fragi]PAA14433.1 hypothetical protein CJU74_15100 [Pseudomonas fragi]